MKNDIFKENEIYNRSKVPKRGMFDFVKKPISKIDDNKVDDTAKNYIESLFGYRTNEQLLNV